MTTKKYEVRSIKHKVGLMAPNVGLLMRSAVSLSRVAALSAVHCASYVSMYRAIGLRALHAAAAPIISCSSLVHHALHMRAAPLNTLHSMYA